MKRSIAIYESETKTIRLEIPVWNDAEWEEENLSEQDIYFLKKMLARSDLVTTRPKMYSVVEVIRDVTLIQDS